MTDRVLVTGGCGFIGSNLVHALVGRGDRVRILDNLRTGRETNIAALRAQHPSQVELWRGDILDSALLDRVLVGVDYILHLAAMPSVPWSIENPLACDQINSQGTLQVLEAARRQGQIRRVVQAVFIAAMVVGGLGVGLWLARRLRDLDGYARRAAYGLVVLGVFVLVRAASFHHVDMLLGFSWNRIAVNVLLELGGIGAIVHSAWGRWRSFAPKP